jgi:hypothetical protein
MGSRAGALLKPAFAVNHASQLTVLPSGTALCAWVSGDAEGADGTALVVSRLPVRPSPPARCPGAEGRGAGGGGAELQCVGCGGWGV